MDNALPASTDAPKQEPTQTTEDVAWTPERAKAIIDKYQGKPEELAKALFSQQAENAKARKELEGFKKSTPKKEAVENIAGEKNELAPVQKDSILKRAMRDYFDNDKLSDELVEDIKKANNFSSDEEYNRFANIMKSEWDNKVKEVQQHIKMPFRDVLKNAPSVLNDQELVAMQVSLDAGVYEVLKHVERKLNAASKEKPTVQHGSVGNSNPTGEKGWSSLDEWSEAMKNPNRGLSEFDKMVAEKSKNTDWAKLRNTTQMGSVRPSFSKPKQ